MPFCHVTLRGQRPPPKAYPRALCTLGDHLRRHRLDRGLSQRELAERLGVNPCTVTNWERNRTQPALRFLPGIFSIIGVDAPPLTTSLGERLKAARRRAGCSQERFARLVGIDPGTLSRWERNLRDPTGRYARLAVAFLGHCERGICSDRNGVAFRLQPSPTRLRG